MRGVTACIVFPSVVFVLLCTTGCGNVTIPLWQRSVEKYIADTGRGDPNVLRDVTLPGGRRGFAVLGHHSPGESTDANGLLLDHREFAGRPWFVYLVGLITEERVKEMRLLALSGDGDTILWRVGNRDKDAERAYRAYNLELVRQRFPDRRKPPVEYLDFPRGEDKFELREDGYGRLVATHVASGVQWRLNLWSAAQ